MTPHELRQMFALRNPAALGILQFFCYNHLHPDLRPIAKVHKDLAIDMMLRLPDGTELVRGLRALLDARDCFIRHYLTSNNFVLSTQYPMLKPVAQNGENQI